jgi:hypothetical protein
MRRSVFIAGLAPALALGVGLFGTGRKSSVEQAQQKASTTEVKVDTLDLNAFGSPVIRTSARFIRR